MIKKVKNALTLHNHKDDDDLQVMMMNSKQTKIKMWKEQNKRRMQTMRSYYKNGIK